MATENQHRPNDFTPVVGAMSLAEYVFHITDNTNKFPDFTVKEEKNPDGTVTQMIIYRPDSLTNTVRDEAREIYHLAYTANEINLNRFEPGSQMVQILGISLLDPMDHAVKEKLRAKVYERYMDDFYIISNDHAFLEECRKVIGEELAKLALELHPKKTRIYPLKDGITVLGFTFRLTPTGKVVRIIRPENVKHERKKLYRMAEKVKKGEMTREKFNDCYGAWKAHAQQGNSFLLLQRMDAYVKSLFQGGEIKNGTCEKVGDDFGTAP